MAADPRQSRRTPGHQVSFGRRNETLLTRIATYGFAVAVAVTAALMLAGYLGDRGREVERSRAFRAVWDVSGPACTRLSPRQFAPFAAYMPKAVEIWDDRIDHRAGEADCFMVSPSLWEGDDFPVCRFTNPYVLRVVSKGGETWFMTGLSPDHLRPATVSLPGGKPRCIAAARWRR